MNNIVFYEECCYLLMCYGCFFIIVLNLNKYLIILSLIVMKLLVLFLVYFYFVSRNCNGEILYILMYNFGLFIFWVNSFGLYVCKEV